MKGNSILSDSPSFNSHSSLRSETADKVIGEFEELNLDEFGLDEELISSSHASPKSHHHHDHHDEHHHEHDDYTDVEDEEEDEENDDDFEFSCACDDHEAITLTADEMFSNGQIRPIYPIFNRDFDDDRSVSSNASPSHPFLLDSFFNHENASSSSSNLAPSELYCILKPRTDLLASPEIRKKSTSTGTSKRWRLRDFIHRSNSDSKETLVILARSGTCSKSKKMREEAAKNAKKIPKSPKFTNNLIKTEKSAHEKHYMKNRELKEGERRRSYLPYKTQLFGFVASVNGLKRDLNPF